MTAYRLARGLIKHGISNFLKITKIPFYYSGEEA